MELQYRTLSTYNRIRIIECLEKMLSNMGAEILRTHYDKQLQIKCYTTEKEVSKIDKINALPIITHYGEHLHLIFLYKGYYFNFGFDTNPFFPMSYEKIKVDSNGKYIGRRYLYTTDDGYPDTLKANLDYDYIFRIIDDNTVKDLALDFLGAIWPYVNYGKENETEYKKERVSNRFDGGYHYEYIYDKSERCIYYNKNKFNHNYIEEVN